MGLLSQTERIAGSIDLETTSPPAVAIDQLLRRISPALKDLRPAYRRIAAEVILPALDEAFASGSSPAGERWESVSADYERRKGGGRTMVRSGALQDALTRASGGGGAIRRFGKATAIIGTSLGYALPLQWGYGTGHVGTARARAIAAAGGREHHSRSGGLRSRIPARSFIAWSTSMTEDASDILIEVLLDLVEASVRAGEA